MPDENKVVDIELRLRANGDAAKTTAADLKEVAKEAEAATITITDYATATEAAAKSTEELAAAEAARQRPSTAQNRAYADEITSTAATAMQGVPDAADAARLEREERKNALLSQQQAIHETILEATQAEARGEMGLAETLREEVQMRQLALQLQRQTTLGEEEAMAMAQEQVNAERAIAAEKAVQARLNAALVAQEEARLAVEKEQAALEAARNKVHGRGGRIGAELQNFGVDQNLATSAGIGALAGMEVYRMIEESAKAIDERRLALDRESASLTKEAQQWRSMAETVKSATDMVKMSDKISASLSGMVQKFREIPSESGLLDGLKGLLNSDPTLNMFGVHLKTSTEQLQDRMSDQLRAQERFAQTMEGLAERNKNAFNDLATIPNVDERIDAIINKVSDLRREQDSLNTSTLKGRERYGELEEQIQSYLKLQNEAMNLSAENQKRAEKTLDLEYQRGKALDENMRKEGQRFLEHEKADHAMRRKEIANELSQLPMSDDEQSAAARDLQQKRDLASNPRTAAEEARNRLYQRREGLRSELFQLGQADAARATDGTAQREQELLRQQEVQRKFDQLPVDLKVAKQAQDGIRGKVDNYSAAGTAAKQVDDLVKRVLKGDNSKGGADQIHELMQKFVDALKDRHEVDQRAETRLKQIETQLETVRSQVRTR